MSSDSSPFTMYVDEWTQEKMKIFLVTGQSTDSSLIA